MVDEADAEEDVKDGSERRCTTSRCLSGVAKTDVRKATETTEASSAMAVSCRDVIGGSRPQRHRVPIRRVRMVGS
jgi:hypothetical protein